MNLSDNEIIKALECCSEPAGKCCCEVCPLHHREDSCTTALIKKAVELVNRQKEEIERYKGVIKILEKDIVVARTEGVKEFAHLIIDKSKDGRIYASDIPDYVKEMAGDSE